MNTRRRIAVLLLAALAVGASFVVSRREPEAAPPAQAAAWEAVQWLRQCASNEARRASFEHARNQGVVPEMMTELMVETDAEARRCQTMTAQHRAMLPELAARAMRASTPASPEVAQGMPLPT